MDVKRLRAALAADPDLGLGNALAKVLEHGADPDGPGLTFDVDVDGHPAFVPLTLGAVNDRVRARAAWLHAHGIRPRDPVAIFATTAPDQLLTLMALARLGAIPAMVNGKLPGEIAAEYIKRLRGVAVLTDQAHRDILAGHDCGTPLLGDLAELGAADPDDAPPPLPAPERRPGGHHPLLRHHRHAQGGPALPRQPVRGHPVAALGHAAGPQHRPHSQCAAGRPRRRHHGHPAGPVQPGRAAVPVHAERLSTCWPPIEGWRPTAVYGFAVTWSELARFDLTERDLSSVSVWFNTGDCAHEAHVRPLVAVGSHAYATAAGVVRRAGSQFVDGLGSTEMGHTMFHMTHGPDTDRYGRCIGRPHRFVEIAVLDPDGHELPARAGRPARRALAHARPGVLERLGHHLPGPAAAATT